VGMSVPGEGGGDDKAMSDINVVPLVDIMLVLLIIFLITIPVITQTVKVDLPKVANQPTKTKPENITVAIDAAGDVFSITPTSARLVGSCGGVVPQDTRDILVAFPKRGLRFIATRSGSGLRIVDMENAEIAEVLGGVASEDRVVAVGPRSLLCRGSVWKYMESELAPREWRLEGWAPEAVEDLLAPRVVSALTVGSLMAPKKWGCSTSADCESAAHFRWGSDLEHLRHNWRCKSVRRAIARWSSWGHSMRVAEYASWDRVRRMEHW